MSAPKPLTGKASQIFLEIIRMVGENDSLRLDVNGEDSGIMPLHVDRLYQTKFMGEDAVVYSFAHYYYQNGDAVSDPDMEFIVAANQYVFPRSYQDTFMYQESIIQEGDKWQWISHIYHQHCDFCNLWMKNLQFQQNIKLKTTTVCQPMP